ncbi:hypothetical protein [Laceyella sediminis]|uniref:hypothetical protein n=1 Tax=Laceyella sediminis TaxID=573074 RepID=UPI000D0724A5|nr:hypothetical protein [Laceyella sediminis]
MSHQPTTPKGTNISADVERIVETLQRLVQDTAKAEKDMQKADHDMKYTKRNWMIAVFTVLIAFISSINLIIYYHGT